MVAFLTIGIFTDLIAKGKYYYTCILVLHGISLTLLLVNIVYNLSTGDNLYKYNKWTFGVSGFLMSAGWFCVYLIVPLQIAAGYREKHSYFEIPMAAQIMGLLLSVQILL